MSALMEQISNKMGVATPPPRLRVVKENERAQATHLEVRNARPEALASFIGQPEVVFNLNVECTAAEMERARLEAEREEGDTAPVSGWLPSHMLLEGPPGLGKTSLARCVADRLGVRFVEIPGTALLKVNDAAAALAKIGQPDDGPAVVFMDEIHIICKKAQVLLLSALEDGWFQPSGAERFELAEFCLIAASTNPGKLDRPVLDRFGVREALDYYPVALEPEEGPREPVLEAIVARYAESQGVRLGEGVAQRVAEVGRGTPRVANSLMRRVAVFAQVAGLEVVSMEMVEAALEQLGIDELGMEEKDRKILRALMHQAHPIGIEALAAILETDDESVKSREGYLIRMGLLRRSGRGRIATKLAYKAMGEIPPVWVPMF